MCSGVPTWLNENAIKSPGYRASSRANEMNFFPQCLSLLISAKVNVWCSCVVYVADTLGKNVSIPKKDINKRWCHQGDKH